MPDAAHVNAIKEQTRAIKEQTRALESINKNLLIVAKALGYNPVVDNLQTYLQEAAAMEQRTDDGTPGP